MNRYAFFDNMTWPVPETDSDDANLEWKLRYSPEALTKSDLMYAASIIAAYGQMIFDPCRKRQNVISKIRNFIRNKS